ncbi:MAG: Flp pilus assembly complex ATPase component TadA [Elusimicrobia bacterium]|nr:Flp pilus assembly complex ATPase component TadA [Elusimicrobiota bacterium]
MTDNEPMGHLVSELDALLGNALPEPSSHDPGPAPVQGNGRPPRVLVIDDNKDYRDLVRTLLSDQGYQVLEAKDGSDGLSLAMDETPDLVITDFNMPRRNGYEFVQEMKSAMETRPIPIIMFSGAPNRQHIKELGLDLVDFLDKPVPNDKLLQTVRRVLGSSGPRTDAPSPAQSALPAEPRSSEKSAPAPEIQEQAEVWQGEEEALLELIKVDKEDKPEAEDFKGLDLLSNNSPIISKVNHILVRAVEMGASDIHIEPQEKQLVVRVRLDGSLRSLCALPASLRARLTARVKIMANLVITERRLPQDGQFQAQIKGRPVEFRVNTLPTAYGEKIVLRVLGQSQINADLGHMGMNARDLECVERTLKSPHGLVLVTGPTGSGKTTTLYTMLGALNTPDVNIMTAEDPIEYRLSGITQSQIRPAIGFGFETVLRAFLRQDPDIMLVGEIRDKETADIAVKASITGHLVLSTLHTNSAAASVVRLTHMGLPAYLVAASVKLVAAQRLVRLLCPACKVPIPLSDEDKRFLSEKEIAALKTVFRSRGCPSCHQSGYSGRRPIFEVMPVASSEVRQLIISPHCSMDLIADLAAKEGMTSLRQAALRVVAEGVTSLPEVYSIVLGE